LRKKYDNDADVKQVYEYAARNSMSVTGCPDCDRRLYRWNDVRRIPEILDTQMPMEFAVMWIKVKRIFCGLSVADRIAENTCCAGILY
jgi:hypothetical protein